jgi:hypothetical protein
MHLDYSLSVRHIYGMTRAQFATAIGVPEKWVHNARAALGVALRYTVSEAQRLAVVRAIQTALPVALPVANAWALAALAAPQRNGPVEVPTDAHAPVRVTIDLPHILSAFTARLSQALHSEPRLRGPRPRQRGRRGPTLREARARALSYGLDLSLIDASLRRSPAERLTSLDANAAFLAVARRGRQTRATLPGRNP